MWEPDHTPSKQELQVGAEVIYDLQEQLRSTQATIASIKKDISTKEAWLAPIRRLPADILSLIFIEICSVRWTRAPILGAVCRRWRQVLLATPRAWAFLRVHPKQPRISDELLDVWLSCCASIKLHISFRSPTALTVIAKHEKNIACLSFFGHLSYLNLSPRFSQLEELRIGRHSFEAWYPKDLTTETGKSDSSPKSDGEERSLLDSRHFPVLKRLHLHGPSRLDSDLKKPWDIELRDISLKAGFPPLQELHMCLTGRYGLDIIRHAADTLVGLAIKFVDFGKEKVDPISLPRLKSLSYFMPPIASETTLFHNPTLITPVLESYCEVQSQTIIRSALHDDTSSVTTFSIRSIRDIDWSKFPELTHVTLDRNLSLILEDCEFLEAHPNYCPKLATMRWTYSTGNEPIIRAIENRNKLSDTKIRCRSVSLDEKNKMYRQNHVKCFTYCNCFGKHLGDVFNELSYEPSELYDDSTDSDEARQFDPDTYDEFYGYDHGWHLREAGYRSGEDDVPYETPAQRRFRLRQYSDNF